MNKLKCIQQNKSIEELNHNQEELEIYSLIQEVIFQFHQQNQYQIIKQMNTIHHTIDLIQSLINNHAKLINYKRIKVILVSLVKFINQKNYSLKCINQENNALKQKKIIIYQIEYKINIKEFKKLKRKRKILKM